MKHLFFLTLFVLSIVPAFGKKRVLWLTLNRPPWFVAKGTYKGQGYGNKITAFLESSMKTVQHKQLLVSFAKAKAMLMDKDGPTVCVAAMTKTLFPAGSVLWSRPLYTVSHYKIIMKQKVWKKLGKPSALSVQELLKRKDMKLGLVRGNAVLGKQTSGAKVRFLVGTDQVMKMLSGDRITWSIEVPMIVGWYSKERKDIVTVDIKEPLKSPRLFARTLCTNNKGGHTTVDAVGALRTPENLKIIQSYLLTWLPGERAKENFLRINSSILQEE